ncbi:hypothetical protein NCCP2648_02420 [Lacticaseibacillus rhamnosus]|nr:hypothetical protein NCCP2648_02420 [Lacticaseibacillus rhamnosus]
MLVGILNGKPQNRLTKGELFFRWEVRFYFVIWRYLLNGSNQALAKNGTYVTPMLTAECHL